MVEVPLLFESGLDHGFDATIAVIADEAIRASGARRPAATRRCPSAPPGSSRQQEKSQRATYTVVNDGTERELQDELSAILDMLPVGPLVSRRDRDRIRTPPDLAPPAPLPGGARRRGAGVAWRVGVALVTAAVVALLLALPLAKRAVNDLGLPLQYPAVIRQQAAAEAPGSGAGGRRHLRRDEVRPPHLLGRGGRA